jgi:putative membrane protein
MAERIPPKSHEIKKQTADIRRSAKAVEQSTTQLTDSADQLTDSADRRTILASDRTLLAAERTYAAWVRTALASLAAGIGARALVKDILPGWVGQVTGSILIVFAGFCLIAAVWREIQGVPRDPSPDIRALPRGLLLPMNLFLLLVAAAALVGIWAR